MTQDGKYITAEDIVELQNKFFRVAEQITSLESRIIDLESPASTDTPSS